MVPANEGPQLRSLKWNNILQAGNMMEHASGVELHNSNRVGGRWRYLLRSVYNKMCADNPILLTNYAVKWALKASNGTEGPSGLISTLLMFRMRPSIPLIGEELRIPGSFKIHERCKDRNIIYLQLKKTLDRYEKYPSSDRIM